LPGDSTKQALTSKYFERKGPTRKKKDRKKVSQVSISTKTGRGKKEYWKPWRGTGGNGLATLVGVKLEKRLEVDTHTKL